MGYLVTAETITLLEGYEADAEVASKADAEAEDLALAAAAAAAAVASSSGSPTSSSLPSSLYDSRAAVDQQLEGAAVAADASVCGAAVADGGSASAPQDALQESGAEINSGSGSGSGGSSGSSIAVAGRLLGQPDPAQERVRRKMQVRVVLVRVFEAHLGFHNWLWCCTQQQRIRGSSAICYHLHTLFLSHSHRGIKN